MRKTNKLELETITIPFVVESSLFIKSSILTFRSTISNTSVSVVVVVVVVFVFVAVLFVEEFEVVLVLLV